MYMGILIRTIKYFLSPCSFISAIVKVQTNCGSLRKHTVMTCVIIMTFLFRGLTQNQKPHPEYRVRNAFVCRYQVCSRPNELLISKNVPKLQS